MPFSASQQALPAVLVEHRSRAPLDRDAVQRRIATGRPSVVSSPAARPRVDARPARPARSATAASRPVSLSRAGLAAAVAVLPGLRARPDVVARASGRGLQAWAEPFRASAAKPRSVAFDEPAGTSAPAGGFVESATLVVQAAILLAAWGRAGGQIDPPDFGTPQDLDPYTTDPRFVRAVKSFQRAWNGAGKSPTLVEDGALDMDTYEALVQVGGAALAAHASAAPPPPPPPPAESSSSSSGALLAAAALAAVAYLAWGK